jgi:type II secretory pathway component PulF
MQDNGWVYLLGMCATILLGVVVLGVLRRLSGPEGVSRRERIGTALGFVGRVLVVVGLLVLAVGLAVLTLAGLLFWVILIAVSLAALAEYRLAQRYALLWALAAAAERSIPLIPIIEAIARERGGTFAWRGRRLAAMLKAGMPLRDAIERSQKLFPRQTLPLIHVGCQSGALAPALRQAASIAKLDQPVWQFVLGRFFYLCCLAYFGLGVVTFLMLKIVPSFEKIFKEFGVQMPAMTQAVIAGARLFTALWFLSVPLLPVFGLLLLYAVFRYAGLLAWDLPGMGPLTRRLDTALIFDALALAAGHQRPLPEAVECLARTYPKPPIRRRLFRALADIHGGRDWCESLRDQGLMKQADRAILQAAQRVGNLPWALREMADSNRRRLAYRLYALVQILFPAVILLFGLAVMFFVVGMFVPLITLIWRLA